MLKPRKFNLILVYVALNIADGNSSEMPLAERIKKRIKEETEKLDVINFQSVFLSL